MKKIRTVWLPGDEKMFDDTFIRFNAIPAGDAVSVADRQTNIQIDILPSALCTVKI